MSDAPHTLGPTCVFHDDEVTNLPSDSPNPPPIKAQFFYVSSVPIDDPLSPLPPVSSDTKSADSHQPQPFSSRDNAALTEAWQGVEHLIASSNKIGKELRRPQLAERGRTLGELVRFPRFKGDGKSPTVASLSKNDKPAAAITETSDHISIKSLDRPSRTSATSLSLQKLKSPPMTEGDGSVVDETSERASQKKRRRFSPFRKTKVPDEGDASTISPAYLVPTDEDADSDISGRPFARTPTLKTVDGQDDKSLVITAAESHCRKREVSSGSPSSPARSKLHNIFHPHKEEEEGQVKEEKVVIPVGVSRLHLVEMPDLLMKPIYWNPINDISAVLRGTWLCE